MNVCVMGECGLYCKSLWKIDRTTKALPFTIILMPLLFWELTEFNICSCLCWLHLRKGKWKWRKREELNGDVWLGESLQEESEAEVKCVGGSTLMCLVASGDLSGSTWPTWRVCAESGGGGGGVWRSNGGDEKDVFIYRINKLELRIGHMTRSFWLSWEIKFEHYRGTGYTVSTIKTT